MALIKKLRKKKKEAPANEKPDVVKTHLRNMVIVPEMTGSIVGVYNGKVFTQVRHRHPDHPAAPRMITRPHPSPLHPLTPSPCRWR